MSEAPKILRAHQLKLLKLPTFLREYEELARQCAAEGLDHVQFLARLFELELIDRERGMKAISFPAVPSVRALPPSRRSVTPQTVSRDRDPARLLFRLPPHRPASTRCAMLHAGDRVRRGASRA